MRGRNGSNAGSSGRRVTFRKKSIDAVGHQSVYCPKVRKPSRYCLPPAILDGESLRQNIK
jgi:hypothetical protein